MRPARCDRSREAISLRLDGMLSTFESALLARHLHGCADCRAFAAGSAAQTQLLRGAELEQPLLQVALPSRRRPARRVAVGALSTVAAVAAAVSVTLLPSGNQPQTSAVRAAAAVQTGAPVLVVVAARPSLGTNETVPRLRLEAASVADGPVHGLFNTPMSA